MANTPIDAAKKEALRTSKSYTILLVVLIIYAILMVLLGTWIFSEHTPSDSLDKLQSPVIIILAIVISVLTFTISSVVFRALGKGSFNNALGMPEGSIRALIALSLITLFFILATQIYSKTTQGGIGKMQHVSEENYKELSVKDIILKEKSDSLKNPSYSDTSKLPKYVYFYNVSFKVATNSDASDMAKNIIASFIALISSICGFYFGSAASKQSSNSSPTTPDTKSFKPAIKITPKIPIPSTGKVGTLMNFEWDVSSPNQLINLEVIGDKDSKLEMDSSNPLKFTYTPGTAGSINLKVSLKSDPSNSEIYQITIA